MHLLLTFVATATANILNQHPIGVLKETTAFEQCTQGCGAQPSLVVQDFQDAHQATSHFWTNDLVGHTAIPGTSKQQFSGYLNSDGRKTLFFW